MFACEYSRWQYHIIITENKVRHVDLCHILTDEIPYFYGEQDEELKDEKIQQH